MLSRDRTGLALLLLACVLYLGFRALVLGRAFEAVALPPYELHNMGNLARLLSLGAAHVPLWMHFDNAGGQQLTALLAAPLFAVFGASYLVLKLVPLLLGLLSLLLLWRIMRREFGLAAAAVAVFLFALGPPTLVKYSLLASGNHFETVIFLLLLHELCSAGHRRGAGRGWLVLEGLVAGLALYVYPGAVVPVALLALAHLLVRGARGALRDLPFAALGVLVGLLPLIAVNVSSGGRTLGFAGRNFAGTGEPLATRLADNVQRILGELLPRAGCFEPLGPLPGGAGDALYLAGFLAAWLVVAAGAVAGLRRLRSQPEAAARWHALRAAPLLLYLPAFVLLLSFGRWDFDAYAPPLQVGQFRYFVSHFTVAAMLAGAAVQALLDRGRAGRLAACALSGALLASSLFTLPIAAAAGPAGAGLVYEGFHFPYYGPLLLAYAERDPATRAVAPDMQVVEGFLRDVPARHALDTWSGVAYAVTGSRVAARGDALAHLAAAANLPPLLDGRAPAVQIALARGVGSALRPLARGDARARESLQRLLRALDQQQHPLAGWVVEGLCLEHESTLSRDVEAQLLASFDVLATVGPRWTAAAAHGFGAQLGRLLARGLDADVPRAAAALLRLPPAARRDAARGVGWGAAELAADADLLRALQAGVPPELLEEALRGAGAARRWLDGPDAAPPALPDAQRAAFARGAQWPGWPAPWWEE